MENNDGGAVVMTAYNHNQDKVFWWRKNYLLLDQLVSQGKFNKFFGM